MTSPVRHANERAAGLQRSAANPAASASSGVMSLKTIPGSG